MSWNPTHSRSRSQSRPRCLNGVKRKKTDAHMQPLSKHSETFSSRMVHKYNKNCLSGLEGGCGETFRGIVSDPHLSSKKEHWIGEGKDRSIRVELSRTRGEVSANAFLKKNKKRKDVNTMKSQDHSKEGETVTNVGKKKEQSAWDCKEGSTENEIRTEKENPRVIHVNLWGRIDMKQLDKGRKEKERHPIPSRHGQGACTCHSGKKNHQKREDNPREHL